MNPKQPQISGLPLPQSSVPAGGYSFAAPLTEPHQNVASVQLDANPAIDAPIPALPQVMPIPPILIAATDEADSDDTDEVDEAWLIKAHEIVDQTRDDPYTQTVALARLRIDFLKSRYGREIKKSEDASR